MLVASSRIRYVTEYLPQIQRSMCCVSSIYNFLYSNESREVGNVIHRVRKPSARPVRFDPDELNDFYATTAQRTRET